MNVDCRREIEKSEPSILAHLLMLGETARSARSAGDLRAGLQNRLQTPLQLLVPKVARDEEATDAADWRDQVSRSVERLLRDEHPSLPALTAVKDWAKQQTLPGQDRAMDEVTTLVYFLCIAKAWITHRQKITRLDDASLVTGFAWAQDQPWADEWIGDCIRKAGDISS